MVPFISSLALISSIIAFKKGTKQGHYFLTGHILISLIFFMCAQETVMQIGILRTIVVVAVVVVRGYIHILMVHDYVSRTYFHLEERRT